MAGWTDLGAQRWNEMASGRRARPTNFYIALIASAVAPNQSTATLGQLTQVAAGNGYPSGGYPLNPNSADFYDSGVTSHKGYQKIRNIQVSANGGPIPASGSVPKYAVLTDDNVVIANREVYHYWDLGTVATLNDGFIDSINGLEMRINT
jgi:hypothetical protein